MSEATTTIPGFQSAGQLTAVERAEALLAFQAYWQTLLDYSAALRSYRDRPHLKLKGMAYADFHQGMRNAFEAGRASK